MIEELDTMQKIEYYSYIILFIITFPIFYTWIRISLPSLVFFYWHCINQNYYSDNPDTKGLAFYKIYKRFLPK